MTLTLIHSSDSPVVAYLSLFLILAVIIGVLAAVAAHYVVSTIIKSMSRDANDSA